MPCSLLAVGIFYIFISPTVISVYYRRANCRNREQKCADTIGTVQVPWLAISNDKILIYFSNEIYGSNFLKLSTCSIRP